MLSVAFRAAFAAFLVVVLAVAFGEAAPAPQAKAKRNQQPTLSVVGRWSMNWAETEYVTTFSEDGTYRAQHDCDKPYTGTWRVENNTLFITETQTPELADSWQSYAVPLDPKTRTGGIVGSKVKIVLRPAEHCW